MESWVQGREKLLEEVARAYDAIGVNLATEIDQENTVRIPKDEWQALQDYTTRYSELEEENTHLIEDLERSKGTVARVEQLERDNKRLQRELELALREKQQLSATPARARLLNKPSPSPTDHVASSAQRVEQSVSATISGDKYDILVKKHNQLYDQWKHHKSRREELEELCKNQREKVGMWEEHSERLKKQTEKKDVKIKQLRVEVARLKSAFGIETESLRNDSPRQTPGSSILGLLAAKEKPWLGAIAAMALNTDVRALADSKAVATPARIVTTSINTHSEIVGDTNFRLEKSANPSLALEDELDILEDLGNNAIIIQDSEDDENEEDGENELPLPKLPWLPENPELSESHHSGSTDESPSPRTGEKKTHDIAVKIAQSSSPVLVSVNCLRKRKALHEANTPTAKIKLERLGSSSPAQRLHSSDSLDLDDIGEKVDTPKKQRRLKELTNEGRALSQGESRSRVHSQLRAVSDQISQETPIGRARDGTSSPLQPLSINKQILPRPSDPRDSKRRRLASDIAIGALAEDGGIFAPVEKPERKDSERRERLTKLLGNPSPEKLVLGSLARGIDSVTRSRVPMAKSAISVYHERAENDEPVKPKSRRPVNQSEQLRPTSASSPSSIRNSEESLRPSSTGSVEPKRPSFISLPKMSGSAIKTVSREKLMNPLTPKIIFSKSKTSDSMTPKVTPTQAILNTSASTSRKRQTRTRQTAEEWENDPEQEPLRLRPVDSLRLEDFRINPNYNQGYKYAFSEVVRGKDDRSSLHACTKPGCCGDKFRALAMAGRNFDLERTPSELEADDKLMRGFLGDNAYKLERMSKSERDGVWIQARARQLGNENGKHRHAYERAPSPPGFWRVDFPTTQEQSEEREKAKEEVRVQVRQRYEEAMRDKGAFIFRDE